VAAAVTALAAAITVSSSRVSASERGQNGAARPSDEEGPALYARMCSDCHDSKRIVAKRRTSSEWETTLKAMIDEGAVGTAKDFEGVFNYLVHTYGKVFINTAPSAEIRAVLGLSAAEADAVVAYRTAKGAFADIEAVKKVPGIDVKKIDELTDALAF
jgi:competence ComEA-like helix-hairpin-helix protein